MRMYNGFGELLEDFIEQSHQTMNRLHTRLAGLGNCSRRALSMSRYNKRASNPNVIKAMEEVRAARTRKKGPRAQARDQRVVDSKEERDSKRQKVLEAIEERKGDEKFNAVQRDIDKHKQLLKEDL